MSLREINYNINTDGISPGVEQFAGTQGDHRVTRLNFVFSDKFHQEIDELGAEGDKVMYRFDVYDGEGGIWSSEAVELTESSVSIELEERHTRFGGKITVYLVITALSADNETQLELYSFPAVLRLKNRPEGTYQDGENYESVTSLAEMAKSNAFAAKSLAADVEEKLKNGEFDGVGVETAEIINDELIITYTDDTVQNLGNVKGDKGPQGEKGEKGDKGDAGKDATIDKTYNAESENAQSGKAVAEAIANTAVLKTKTTYSTEAGKIPVFSDANTIRSGTPQIQQDCANKKYVDDAVANAVGSVNLSNYYTKNEVDNLEAVKSIGFKDYDGLPHTEIKDPYGTVVLALSEAESVVDVKDNYISNVRYPLESTDAATKGYVDDAVPNYELIEEITVTEDVEQILKTTSPDGTPYNFKAVTIEFSSVGVTGYSGKQLIEFNDGRVFKGNAEFLSDNRISIIRGIYCGGLTFYDATWNAQSANNTTLNQNGYAIVPKIAQENVTKIHIRSAVKAGTVIKIYGIKV